MISPNRLLLPTATLAVLAFSAPNSFGFAEIASGALLLETTASVTYDSYFLGTRTNDADYYGSLQPSLRYSRNVGLAQWNAAAGVGFVRYDENDDLDSEDFFANASVNLPPLDGTRLNGSISITYSESTVVDIYVNDRVPTRSFGASANFNYKLGLKTGLSDSVSYSRSFREIYSDQESWSNDISFTYGDFFYGTSASLSHNYTRTLSSGDNYLGADLDQYSNSFSAGVSRPLFGPVIGSANVGYRMLNRSARETTVGQTKDNGVFFGIGLNGPFLPRSKFPKLTSSASLNYQESRSAGINDTGGKTLTGSVNLNWDARDRTQVFVRASRSTDLSANDLSVVNTTISGGVNERVGHATFLDGSLSYTWATFRGIDRSDGIFDASLGARRTLNKNWNCGASYRYQRVDNQASGFQPTRFQTRDYERHLVSVSITNIF